MSASLDRLDHDALVAWLREERSEELQRLWTAADEVRRSNVGAEVHLRGLIEISSHCMRRCAYCGLSVENREIERYRMSADEILDCARLSKRLGYGTVVLQAGEDAQLTRGWIARLVSEIKAETGLAVTLSLGERSAVELAAWRAAGADRYLLRFETSDDGLYRAIHPRHAKGPAHRLEMIPQLKDLGYEAGSGVMVGIPGQSFDILARDIAFFRDLDLDMIGVGPYIAHPATPLGRGDLPSLPDGEQVPHSELMTYKVLALTRLVRPDANIPATTALATINTVQGRELGLARGANVVMPNLTPTRYRKLYEIYPAKACVGESAEDCSSCLDLRIASIGRSVGKGPGSRLRRADSDTP
jgi:biotin synthase